MAYIRKLTGGRWRAEVQRNGVRKTAVWDTKSQASAWALKTEIEIDSRGKSAKSMSWPDAIALYAKTQSSRKRGERWEQIRLQKMLPIFRGDIGGVVQADIACWRDDRLKNVSAATVLREANLLRNIFRVAKDEWGVVHTDPWVGVRMPKQPPPRTSTWGWREVKRVCRFLGYITGRQPETKQQEVALAFLIALRTGMRAGEVLQVGPKSVSGRVVTLTDTKTEKMAKVPLTRAGLRLCKTVVAWSIDDASRDALFRKARDATLCGDLRFHDARATALTLLSRKVDVMTLARISRHKNLNLLQNTYYRETAEQIAARI